MKKFMMLAVAAMIAILPAAAKSRIIAATELPVAAQLFIEKNFGKNVIHHAKMDKEAFGGVEYDVVLTDGTEIEFNKDGAMTEIDSGAKGVPASIVPQAIKAYCDKYYPKQPIVELKCEKKGYEVQLRSGVELKFDAAGRFIKIDR